MEYLYILRSYSKDSSILKFGFTTDIWSRLAQYKSANPFIEIVYIAQLENAFELEQSFHKEHPATFGNEWYEETLLPTMMEFLNSINHIDYTEENKPERVYNPKYEVIGEDFKSILKEYCDWIDNKIESTLQEKKDRISYLLNIEPSIADIVSEIGTNKCRTLGYTKKAIRLYIHSCSEEINDIIQLNVSGKYIKGEMYTSKEIKKYLQELYDSLNIVKKAKGTDISYYLPTTNARKYINGIKTNCFVIQ